MALERATDVSVSTVGATQTVAVVLAAAPDETLVTYVPTRQGALAVFSQATACALLKAAIVGSLRRTSALRKPLSVSASLSRRLRPPV